MDGQQNGLPSREETTRVVKQLQELTDEVRELSARLTVLAQKESSPRPQQRRRSASYVKRKHR
jgi:hypothetical protein